MNLFIKVWKASGSLPWYRYLTWGTLLAFVGIVHINLTSRGPFFVFPDTIIFFVVVFLNTRFNPFVQEFIIKYIFTLRIFRFNIREIMRKTEEDELAAGPRITAHHTVYGNTVSTRYETEDASFLRLRAKTNARIDGLLFLFFKILLYYPMKLWLLGMAWMGSFAYGWIFVYFYARRKEREEVQEEFTVDEYVESQELYDDFEVADLTEEEIDTDVISE